MVKKEGENYIITAVGKTLKTKYFDENFTDEQCKALSDDYYEKPTLKEVTSEMLSLAEGQNKTAKFTRYFVHHLMSKVVLYSATWAIEDVFGDYDLLRHFVAKTKANDKVFPPELPLIKNVETSFRISGGACKPTNFPIISVREILEKYNINGNYYDFSCGWGPRMMGALSSYINYYGTDPNYLLTEQLDKMQKMFRNVTGITDPICDIRTHGSEKLVKEWTGKMGVAFSSPPYFGLEDYKIGDQSVKEDTTFTQWNDDYLIPTMRNIYQYLLKDGCLLVNIKDYNKMPLVQVTIDACNKVGFKMVGTHKLHVTKRPKSDGTFVESEAADEDIMVFKKREIKFKNFNNC